MVFLGRTNKTSTGMFCSLLFINCRKNMGKMEGKPEGWRMEKAGHSFRYLSGRLKQLLLFSLQKSYAERRDLALYDGRSKSNKVNV